ARQGIGITELVFVHQVAPVVLEPEGEEGYQVPVADVFDLPQQPEIGMVLVPTELDDLDRDRCRLPNLGAFPFTEQLGKAIDWDRGIALLVSWLRLGKPLSQRLSQPLDCLLQSTDKGHRGGVAIFWTQCRRPPDHLLFGGGKSGEVETLCGHAPEKN